MVLLILTVALISVFEIMQMRRKKQKKRNNCFCGFICYSPFFRLDICFQSA